MRSIAVVAGFTGVAIELYGFRYLLIECKPYKIMDAPPAGVFASLANWGAALIVFVALVAAWILRRRAPISDCSVSCRACRSHSWDC